MRVECAELYHPLLSEPVKNSAVFEQNTLFTGSNASGKSTFLKAIAVNALLAGCLGVCCAEKFRLPFIPVVSSMAVRDDLLAGESYFIAELRSLLRLVRQAQAGPCLCFVDEILKAVSYTHLPPLLREHRLYQADWLLRFYHFTAGEILDEKNQNFNPYLDPKCNWAIHNLHLFPVDVNTCSYEMLLRVPGIGVKSAQRIRTARRNGRLGLPELKRIGVVLKRAQFFIVCKGFHLSLIHI